MRVSPETWFELAELLDDEVFKDMLVQYAFVLLPVIEPSKVDGQTLIQIKEYVDAAMIEKSHNLKQEIIKKIDTIIYNLYDISNEEILHIEGIS